MPTILHIIPAKYSTRKEVPEFTFYSSLNKCKSTFFLLQRTTARAPFFSAGEVGLLSWWLVSKAVYLWILVSPPKIINFCSVMYAYPLSCRSLAIVLQILWVTCSLFPTEFLFVNMQLSQSTVRISVTAQAPCRLTW